MEILEHEYSNWTRLWNSHRIQLLTVDLYTVFAYWEIDSLHKEILSTHFQQDWPLLPLFVQLYDVTKTGVVHNLTPTVKRIRISQEDDHWYFRNLTPNRQYVIDLGTITNNGHFLTILRSQVTSTPSLRDYPLLSLLSPESEELTRGPDRNPNSHTKDISSYPLSSIPYSDEFDGYSLVGRRELQ